MTNADTLYVYFLSSEQEFDGTDLQESCTLVPYLGHSPDPVVAPDHPCALVRGGKGDPSPAHLYCAGLYHRLDSGLAHRSLCRSR